MCCGSEAAVTSAMAADASRHETNGSPDTPTVMDPETSSASMVRLPVVGTFRNVR